MDGPREGFRPALQSCVMRDACAAPSSRASVVCLPRSLVPCLALGSGWAERPPVPKDPVTERDD